MRRQAIAEYLIAIVSKYKKSTKSEKAKILNDAQEMIVEIPIKATRKKALIKKKLKAKKVFSRKQFKFRRLLD